MSDTRKTLHSLDSTGSNGDSDLDPKLKRQIEGERRRQEQKVIKKLKRNRKPAPPRQKHWKAEAFDDPEAAADFDLITHERIMALNEDARRKGVAARAAQSIEDQPDADDSGQDETQSAGELTGVVSEIGSSLCRVLLSENGGHSLTQEVLCHLRGTLSAHDTAFTNVIAVGDRVQISLDAAAGQGVVEHVSPRRSALLRPDPFSPHLRQVIAANIDQLLIIAAWRDPHFWPELVDRYLIAAERNRLDAILCVNKIDLAEDMTECRAYVQPYAALGLRLLFTSTVSGEGIPELRAALAGKSTVLAGLSGVGKSSLLRVAMPSFNLRTQPVSTQSGEGRHTTTQATLLPFGDGYVVDTPGIRQLGLNGLERADLIRFYPDLEVFAEGCRFRDCLPASEDGCAVRVAAEQGPIPALRYETYRKLLTKIE